LIDYLLVIPAAFNGRRAGHAGGASQQRSVSCLRWDDEQNQTIPDATARCTPLARPAPSLTPSHRVVPRP